VTSARASAIERRLDASHLRIVQVSKRLGLRWFDWSGFVGLRRLTSKFPAPAARWAASVPTGPVRVGGSGVLHKVQCMVGPANREGRFGNLQTLSEIVQAGWHGSREN
jgi:hypothetical protein